MNPDLSIKKALVKIYDRTRYDQKGHFSEIVFGHLGDKNNILDVGCGSGRFVEKSPDRIVGLDSSQASVELCLRNGLIAKLGSATEIPFGDSSFDGVLCSHLIEHLLPQDAHKLLSEIDRVLEIDGLFILITPLLSDRFYGDFTHVKPYYPQAILHYLQADDQRKESPGRLKDKFTRFLGTDKLDAANEEWTQRTLPRIKGEYEVAALHYLRARLLSGISRSSFWAFLIPVLNLLHRNGIASPRKIGYLLALRKVAGGDPEMQIELP